jgi:pimeloyl-ACP methyl ester carboxylesterase
MPHLKMRDGAKLHYLSIGRGTPFVLIHGFGMRAAHWLPFVLPLAHKARFILPDMRGFGGSHRISASQPDVINNYADDVEDLCEGLGLDDLLLGGLSMGGLTSMQYQRSYGFGRVRAYVNIDQSPMVKNAPDWRWGLFGREHEARIAEMRELIRAMEGFGRDRPWHEAPAPMRAQLWMALARFMGDAFHGLPMSLGLMLLLRYEVIGRRLMPPDNWAAYLDCMNAYMDRDYDMRQSLSGIKVPTTLFVGMDSYMYPAQGQLWMQSRIPHAKVVRFHRCGHGIPLEAPRQFMSELGRFIDENRRSGLPRKGFTVLRRGEKVLELRRRKTA